MAYLDFTYSNFTSIPYHNRIVPVGQAKETVEIDNNLSFDIHCPVLGDFRRVDFFCPSELLTRREMRAV